MQISCELLRARYATVFLNSGQTSTALTRLIVPDERYTDVCAIAIEEAKHFLPGDPLLSGIKMGPLASLSQVERVRDYIRRGLDEGAELLCGGPETPENVDRILCQANNIWARQPA